VYVLDPVVTPENFAQSVVEDYGLAANYHTVITKSIQDQLSDFKAHSTNYDGDGGDLSAEDTLKNGELDEAEAAWWESWRKRLRSDTALVQRGKRGVGKGRKRRKVLKEEVLALSDLPNEADHENPMNLDDFEVDEQSMHEDMRILIKVRVRFRLMVCGD